MIYLFIKQYYRSIIIGLLILWLSLSGSKTLVPGRMLNIPYIDKMGHFAMYAFFSAVLLLDSAKWRTSSHFRYIILLIPVFFGAMMEIMQMTLTTSRKAETIDLLANIGGVTAGIILAHIALKILEKTGLNHRGRAD
ncbi:MAG: VanZ family protein [Bacteroidales bacterium]|jgi:VanZ family protein|nr:VanZ family protein [Bacteroidales bacterium]